jgi:hypothetical protein
VWLLAIVVGVLLLVVESQLMPPFPAMTEERREQLRQHRNRIRKLRGVKNVKNQAANMTTRGLMRWPMFRDAPRALVAGYARLLNLSNIVDSKLAQNGVLRDGQWAVVWIYFAA